MATPYPYTPVQAQTVASPTPSMFSSAYYAPTSNTGWYKQLYDNATSTNLAAFIMVIILVALVVLGWLALGKLYDTNLTTNQEKLNKAKPLITWFAWISGITAALSFGIMLWYLVSGGNSPDRMYMVGTSFLAGVALAISCSFAISAKAEIDKVVPANELLLNNKIDLVRKNMSTAFTILVAAASFAMGYAFKLASAPKCP
jgi:hypothetical protein